ncbi:hypothetical protein [Deinococcus multiflagellatus]|uniref:Uncharacterized protein n=1 Tax=Deinococcus multiflagellatus TaxID=1656887 RepID=A0ABW1ZQ29_9DEIO
MEVTDSTLSTKSRTITMNVQDLPPLSLAPTLPAGQIRGETRIPLTITAPRSVRAARFAWDLPAGVTVTRVQPEGATWCSGASRAAAWWWTWALKPCRAPGPAWPC